MHSRAPQDFAQWRDAARGLLGAGVRPDEIAWCSDASDDLLGDDRALRAPDSARATALPRALLAELEACACHRDPSRWALMYRLLHRAAHGERAILDLAADDDVRELTLRVKAVRRDCHKMKAFVRFRETTDESGGACYVAWFEPDHHILRRVAPFFVDRYAGMRWTIVTPDGAARWDGEALEFIATAAAGALPAPDAAETLWRTYYSRIFNPARLNVRLMCKEMPVRYWKNLPEASAIPLLVADAGARTHRMIAAAPSAPARAARQPIGSPAAEGLEACRRCDLWRDATQAVPGRGPRPAALMLVGEQPGDEEDLRGSPFVGPAGRLLAALLAEAGIDIDAVYLTNAVKHFKWTPRGKRRLHKTPAQREVEACSDWLEGEIVAVAPRVIVALGATALAALGHRGPVGTSRGGESRHLASGIGIVPTWHPAALLRAEPDRMAELRRDVLADLARAQARAGP